MKDTIVYIAQNEMGIIHEGKASVLESQRLRRYEQNLRELEQKYAWKSEGHGAQFMRQRNPYAGASQQKGHITSVAPYGDGLIYGMSTGDMGGLFRKNPFAPAEDEGLFYSDKGFLADDLCVCGDTVLFSISGVFGERHIARFVAGEAGYQLLTEGDTSERFPSFSRGKDAIYYAAAGYARDAQRTPLGISPYAILRLCLTTGDVEELHADPKRDLLKLCEDRRGGHFLMARPYRGNGRGADPMNLLRAPVRFLKAVGGFLNMFSMRYGGEPLQGDGASATKAAQQSQREMFIDGNLIHAEKTLAENKKRGDQNPGIAPKDWQLLRVRDSDSGFEVVKQGVIDYALLEDGGFVYTNGRYVISCDAQGHETVLLKDKLVTRVAVLPKQTAVAQTGGGHVAV